MPTKEYYREHREECISKVKKWRLDNLEYSLEYDRKRHSTDEYRKKAREYRLKNIDRIKEYDKAYRKEHKYSYVNNPRKREMEQKRRKEYRQTHSEEIRKYRKKYNKENREKDRLYLKSWRLLNPDSERIGSEKRRAKIKNSSGYGVTKKEWEWVVNMFNGRCAYCGKEGKMQMEHVDPINRGGSHDISNIVPACKSCNSSKHDKSVREFLLFA